MASFSLGGSAADSAYEPKSRGSYPRVEIAGRRVGCGFDGPGCCYGVTRQLPDLVEELLVGEASY